jgi:DNA-directed RNA polymerase specialized sigma24 family protein
VRRQGNTPQDAEDLTQEFFARFLESHALRTVSPQRVPFRSLLLAALNHFLTNEWKRTGTLKRGGGICFLSLDQAAAEDRYRLEPVNDLTPENIFERRWALTLLDQVLTDCVTSAWLTAIPNFRHFAGSYPTLPSLGLTPSSRSNLERAKPRRVGLSAACGGIAN